MRAMRPPFTFVAAIAVVAVVTAAAGAQRGHAKMKGQIIAYRPAERVSQMASHVLNRESFLFKGNTAESNSHPVVTKIVYEHFGYSDLGSDLLDKAPTLQLSVHRDTTCDETYGAFIQNSPTLKQDQAKSDSGDRVIFIGPFQKMKLSPEQPLNCYKLQSGNFRIQPSNTGSMKGNVKRMFFPGDGGED